MLNKELSHFSESSKSGNQISEYICSTFLGKSNVILFLVEIITKRIKRYKLQVRAEIKVWRISFLHALKKKDCVFASIGENDWKEIRETASNEVIAGSKFMGAIKRALLRIKSPWKTVAGIAVIIHSG